MSQATIPLNLLSCQQCVLLLKSIGCTNFEEAFVKNNLTGLDLEYVEKVDDLRELGTSLPMIKLRRLFDELKNWQSKGVPSSAFLNSSSNSIPAKVSAVAASALKNQSSKSRPSTASPVIPVVAPGKAEDENNSKKRPRDKKSSAKQIFNDSRSESGIDSDIIDVDSDYSTSPVPKKKPATAASSSSAQKSALVSSSSNNKTTSSNKRSVPTKEEDDQDLIVRFMKGSAANRVSVRTPTSAPRSSVGKTASSSSSSKAEAKSSSTKSKPSTSSSTSHVQSAPVPRPVVKSHYNPRIAEDVNAFLLRLDSWETDKVVAFMFQVFLIQAKNADFNKELFQANVLETIIKLLKLQDIAERSVSFQQQHLSSLLRCICAILFLGKDDVFQVLDKAVLRFDRLMGYDLMLLMLRKCTTAPALLEAEAQSSRREVIKWACRNLQLVEVCRPDTKSIRQGLDFPHLIAIALEAGKECAEASIQSPQMSATNQKIRLDVFVDCLKAISYLIFCLHSKDFKGPILLNIYALHELIFHSFGQNNMVMRYFSLAISRFAVGTQYVKQIISKLDAVTCMLKSLEHFIQEGAVPTVSIICQALFELSFDTSCRRSIVQFRSTSVETKAGSCPNVVQYLMYLLRNNLENEELVMNICAMITNISCEETGIDAILSPFKVTDSARSTSSLLASDGQYQEKAQNAIKKLHHIDEFAKTLMTALQQYLKNDFIFQYLCNSLINLAFSKELTIAFGQHQCCELLSAALFHYSSLKGNHSSNYEKTLLFNLRAIINMSQYSENQVKFIGSTSFAAVPSSSSSSSSSSSKLSYQNHDSNKLCELLHQMLQTHMRNKELSVRIVKTMANLSRFQKDIQQLFGQLGTLELLVEMMESFFNNHVVMVEICGLLSILTALEGNVVLLQKSQTFFKLIINTLKSYLKHEDIMLPLTTILLHVSQDNVCVKIVVKQFPALCQYLVDVIDNYKGHYFLQNASDEDTPPANKPAEEKGEGEGIGSEDGEMLEVNQSSSSHRFSTAVDVTGEGGIDLSVYEILAVLVRQQDFAKRLSKLGLASIMIEDLLDLDYCKSGIFMEEVVDILSYLLQAEEANQILMEAKQNKAWHALLALLTIHSNNKIILHALCQCFENLSVTLPGSLFLESTFVSDAILCLQKHQKDKDLFIKFNDLLQTFYIAILQEEDNNKILWKQKDVVILLNLLQNFHSYVTYVEPLCQSLKLFLKYQSKQSIALFLIHNGGDVLTETLRWYINKRLVVFPCSLLLLIAQLCKDQQTLQYFQQARISEDLALMLQYAEVCQRLRITEHIVDTIKVLENQQFRQTNSSNQYETVSEVEFIV